MSETWNIIDSTSSRAAEAHIYNTVFIFIHLFTSNLNRHKISNPKKSNMKL